MHQSIFYIDNSKTDHVHTQMMEPPIRTLDFAFDGAFEINGTLLPASYWRSSECLIAERKIKTAGADSAYFFSVKLHKNPYSVCQKNGIAKEGLFTATMGYPILKLISEMENGNADDTQELRIASYTSLLLQLLDKEPLKKSAICFGELKTTYQHIEQLFACPAKFPNPTDFIRQTGLKKFRFQRGCHALYGQPVRKIIQHLKMKQAFENIVANRKAIQLTSSVLGYRGSDNFITAFRHHFGVTPLVAAQYQPN
jgi:AraC-like DNA-binding protein